MMIASCGAFLYDLPLLEAMDLGGSKLLSRSGFIIRLEDGEGHYGYGEVAPFPGLHKEDRAAALRQFKRLKSEWLGRRLSDRLRQLNGKFEGWLGDLFPSLRFGVEMAVLNLLACRTGISLAALLAPSYPRFLPVNGLLLTGQNIDDIEARLMELGAAGFTAVKLKVGRTSLQQDIDLVRTARRVLGDAVKLRLDANRRWDFATAVKFGKAVADYNIEYIEEPLADSSRLADFHRSTTIPIALDESLSAQNPWSMEVPRAVHALVLKPAVLGGLERTGGFVDLAKRLGIKAVISSVFESGAGLAALANCAAALAGGENPAGLDTYRWLGDDVLAKRFAGQGASIDVDQVHGLAQHLRSDLLAKSL